MAELIYTTEARLSLSTVETGMYSPLFDRSCNDYSWESQKMWLITRLQKRN